MPCRCRGRFKGIVGGPGGGLGGVASSGGRRRPAEGFGAPVTPPEALKALPQEKPKAMTTLDWANAQVTEYFVRSLVVKELCDEDVALFEENVDGDRRRHPSRLYEAQYDHQAYFSI